MILPIITFFLACTCIFAQGKTGPEYQTKALTAYERTLPTFYKSLRDKMPFEMGWKDGKDVATWKKEGLAKAKELMIHFEDNTPFNMEVIAEEKRSGYVAKKVVFNLTEDSRVMALLLVPEQKRKDRGKPMPAALMLHDHGSKFTIGKEKMVQTFGTDEVSQSRLTESKEWAKNYFSGLFIGDELAKRGYVVLSFDALGWGDRSVKRYRNESQQALASNLFNLGTSYAGMIAMEDCRAASFLASLPEVDKTRIVSVGFSMGAFRSWQLSALSNDITASISACWMATMQGLMTDDNNQLKGQSAFTMLHPFIAKYLDYPDVAGLAAPKPMLVFAGEMDHLFPKESVAEAFDKMAKIWNAHGAKDKLVTKFWPKGHAFEQDQQAEAFAWIDSVFGVTNK
ncbi:MAG: hydrolase [Treponema sp.]|nr:hydrolase [Treponema sp.]